MDKIRKALDLAREERQRPGESHGESSRPFESRPFESRPVVRLPAAIQYTTTKTFSPPSGMLEANRIIDSSGTSAAAAAFRMLRTQVLQRMDEHRWRSLAVMSPSAHDGKTTTAINLAISLANDQRHTVLLVDFDFKRPSVGELLGLRPEAGADDVLRGDARLEDCLYHPENVERLVILPARATMGSSSEALAGPRCRDLVAELRGRYPERLVLFDLPPVLGADDALAFAPLVECALVVVAERATRRNDLLRCMELLRNTPVVGTVLSRASDPGKVYG